MTPDEYTTERIATALERTADTNDQIAASYARLAEAGRMLAESANLIRAALERQADATETLAEHSQEAERLDKIEITLRHKAMVDSARRAHDYYVQLNRHIEHQHADGDADEDEVAEVESVRQRAEWAEQQVRDFERAYTFLTPAIFRVSDLVG